MIRPYTLWAFLVRVFSNRNRAHVHVQDGPSDSSLRWFQDALFTHVFKSQIDVFLVSSFISLIKTQWIFWCFMFSDTNRFGDNKCLGLLGNDKHNADCNGPNPSKHGFDRKRLWFMAYISSMFLENQPAIHQRDRFCCSCWVIWVTWYHQWPLGSKTDHRTQHVSGQIPHVKCQVWLLPVFNNCLVDFVVFLL